MVPEYGIAGGMLATDSCDEGRQVHVCLSHLSWQEPALPPRAWTLGLLIGRPCGLLAALACSGYEDDGNIVLLLRFVDDDKKCRWRAL